MFIIDLKVLGDEWVIQNLIDCQSVFGFDLQDSLDEIFGIGVDIFLVFYRIGYDILPDLAHVHGGVGGPAMHHFEEKDSDGPDINSKALLLLEHNFGRHILISAADCIPPCVAIVLCTPPEVTKLNVHLGIQQKILWFNVPVDHSNLVDVFQSHCSLCKELAGLNIIQRLLFADQVVVEVAIHGDFEEEMDFLVHKSMSVVLDHVGMVELGMAHDFSSDVDQVILAGLSEVDLGGLKLKLPL